MNTQDRAVVKALLQHMTDKCLTGSEEFRAALKHFNVTTAWQSKVGHFEPVFIVDVLSPETIDAQPHGKRYSFDTEAEATAFAARERTNGDAPATDDGAAGEEYRNKVRAVIARALHVAANSFGHVIGEHEELVETLTGLGFTDAARRVDAIMDRIGGETHKDIRSNWRRELQVVSDGL